MKGVDRRNLAVIFYLGFASGLPLMLTLSTLSAWLKESGISLQAIGLSTLVGLPYALKFLWAPLKDAYDVPILTRRLDRRRAWLFTTQLALASCLYVIGFYDPAADLRAVMIFSVLIAFCSASQDIVSDAYRIELQQQRHLGTGAAVQSFGYRAGMLASGAGSLYLASVLPWGLVYQIMGAVMGLCAVIALFCPKNPGEAVRGAYDLIGSFVNPLRDFLARANWGYIALFALTFKLGDAFATSLATPFYLELGFTKPEIATISKIFGPAAFLAGGFIGGWLVEKIGMWRSLWYGGWLQAIGILPFAALAVAGHDLVMLTIAIGAEAVTSGLGSAAFVAYLSSLCNARYTASQYALLTSLMAVARTVLSSGSGYVAVETGWPLFFVLAALLCLPGLWILRKLK